MRALGLSLRTNMKMCYSKVFINLKVLNLVTGDTVLELERTLIKSSPESHTGQKMPFVGHWSTLSLMRSAAWLCLMV